jgi:hypothetical protein
MREPHHLTAVWASTACYVNFVFTFAVGAKCLLNEHLSEFDYMEVGNENEIF